MAEFDAIPEDLPQYPVYICNLPYNIDESEFRSMFAEAGEIITSRLFANPGGRKTGSAIVNYRHKASAVRAFRKFHDFPLNGRTLHLEWGKDVSEKYLHELPPSRRASYREPPREPDPPPMPAYPQYQPYDFFAYAYPPAAPPYPPAYPPPYPGPMPPYPAAPMPPPPPHRRGAHPHRRFEEDPPR
jgi:RNA recognition motif-containing protein